MATHTDEHYYVPHGSHWPAVGSVGLLFMMVGVSAWLNGADPGFYVMLVGIAVMLFAPRGLWGLISERTGLQLFPIRRRLVGSSKTKGEG